MIKQKTVHTIDLWVRLLRHGGDLGWQDEQHFHPDFANAVKVIGIDTIGPPVISPWGVHIVLRTG